MAPPTPAEPPPLLHSTTAELQQLLLDPGDELSLAERSAAEEAAFIRAFLPVRAFERLLETGLDGLASAIARAPEQLRGRILVRDYGSGDGVERWVVIDGSRHVAALRVLAESGDPNSEPLSSEVMDLLRRCPITVVDPSTDPALVLAMLADGTEHGDPWLNGQRDRLLRQLREQSVHHSWATIHAEVGDDEQLLRRFHAHRALQQMMQLQRVSVPVAAALYPLFHAAMGRSVIREWLDWDDTLCCSIDDTALDHFHRLLSPTTAADGSTRPPCITTVAHVGQLCDALSEPAARRVLLEPGGTLDAAAEVINAGAFQQFTTQVGQASETIRWDRRRFRRP